MCSVATTVSKTVLGVQEGAKMAAEEEPGLHPSRIHAEPIPAYRAILPEEELMAE